MMEITLPSTMVSIPETGIDFKGVEQICWEAGRAVARQLLQTVLQERDAALSAEREVPTLRFKDRKRRRLVTLMGDVSVVRRRYWDRRRQTYRFLLDEALGLVPQVAVVGQVAELGLWLATQGSYGQASRLVSALVGVAVSRQAIWRAVQGRGAALAAEAAAQREAVFTHGVVPPAPAVVPPVLFGEADGCLIAQQRGRLMEVKVGVWYEGWQRQPVTRDEYALVGKSSVATLASADAFWEELAVVGETRYGRSAIGPVYVGGDGARWITEGTQVLGPTRVKLDAFHLHRLLGRAFGWPPELGAVVGQLLDGQWDPPMRTVIGWALAEPDAARRKDMAQALAFLDHHRALLARIRYPAGLRRGRVLRQLGTMERQVDLIVAERFKKRGMSWSRRGAEHLVRLRVQVLNGTWACPLPTPVAVPMPPTSPSRPRRAPLPVHVAHVPVIIGPHQGRPWVKRLKARLQFHSIGAA